MTLPVKMPFDLPPLHTTSSCFISSGIVLLMLVSPARPTFRVYGQAVLPHLPGLHWYQGVLNITVKLLNTRLHYTLQHSIKVKEIPNEWTVWVNGRPLLRTQKCIDFGISRPLLRTKKYIDFGISQKCPFIRTHKYTDFGISRKCPLLRNLLYFEPRIGCTYARSPQLVFAC